MSKLYRAMPLLVILVLTLGFVKGDRDIYFEISRGIDIFGKVYKEISLRYVDEIDPREFMLKGIEGMLSSLDPYTVYIDEDMQKDVDVITLGKYGGIGATIGIREGKVTVVDLIEGYSAQRQGLLIGDVILSIDEIKIDQKNYQDIGKYLKGEAGSTVDVKVRREGSGDPLIYSLVRENIEIKNVSYYGFVPENSGNVYIKLSSFSRAAGEEVKKALFELGEKKEIESVVLDLRGNPGGLLDAAVDVAEKFVDKGDLIVSVKGRDEEITETYLSKEAPAAGKARVAVLIDGHSASASEIVAGAIQDHDRGIIIGENSFGKGLVQTLIPLSYNTSLKITTAKYYTPSGRCIQRINYSKNDNDLFDASEAVDSFIYRTDQGREVFAEGGISPDSLVSGKTGSSTLEYLYARGMFFNFATTFFNGNKELDFEALDSGKLFNSFVTFVDSSGFEFRSKPEKLLEDLKKATSGYDEEFNRTLKKLTDMAELEKKKELETHKKEVINGIKNELAGRFQGKEGRIKEQLKHDVQFETALSLLKDEISYAALLASSASVN